MAVDNARSFEESHWDNFCEYCDQNGISLDHPDDWEAWWECWNAALDTREHHEEIAANVPPQ